MLPYMDVSQFCRRRGSSARATNTLEPGDAVELQPRLVDLQRIDIHVKEMEAFRGAVVGSDPVPGDVVAAADDNLDRVKFGWSGSEDGGDVVLLVCEGYGAKLVRVSTDACRNG